MVYVSGAVASVYVQQHELGIEELCVQSAGCISVDPLSQLGFVVWMSVLLGAATVGVAQLRDAQDALDKERTRTIAERDAFARFIHQVDSIEDDQIRPQSASHPHSSSFKGDATAIETHQQQHHSLGLQQVRNGYRETVMAVEHYEEEYDESLAENLAAEFGEAVATAICQTAQLTPLQQALLQKRQESYNERKEFVNRLDEEDEQLLAAHEQLTDLDKACEEIEQDILECPSSVPSFSEAYQAWHRLRNLEAECNQFLTDRQCFVQETGTFGRGDATNFYGYLYESLDVTYPVLAAGTSLCDRMQVAQCRTGQELTRQV